MKYLYTLGFFIAALQLSCGKAEAKKQAIDTTPIPTYPSLGTGLFALDPSKEVTGYGGTIALFNQKADPADIADLLQASINSREAWGEATQFSEENQYNLL